jgi:S1 RNA binding domain protein
MSSVIEIGSIIEGTVVKLAEYGAIVRLVGGKMGLVHISEVTDAYVRDVHDYFNENDRITVKVLKLTNKGRYELSTKQTETTPDPRPEPQLVEQEPARRPIPAPVWESPHRPSPQNFEDRLSRFLKESEERLHDVKHNIEAKRGRARR